MNKQTVMSLMAFNVATGAFFGGLAGYSMGVVGPAIISCGMSEPCWESRRFAHRAAVCGGLIGGSIVLTGHGIFFGGLYLFRNSAKYTQRLKQAKRPS